METINTPVYGSWEGNRDASSRTFPKHSIPPRIAYSLVHDECQLDGNARLNLATFVTTWMEQESRDLIMETLEKNMIDKTEYPQTAEIEKRCVNMIADLWNAPKQEGYYAGCSTIGSSEACMLAGMALRILWKRKRKDAGLPFDKPNLVISAGFQVCWEKFCRYWDIELREIPMSEGRYKLDNKLAVEACDENTIGVVSILGVTYTGEYEDVQDLSNQLDKLQKKTGLDIPVHVDAATGGFIAPFLDAKLKWDFRVDRVVSINASGHKFGLVYPGVGWILWRNFDQVPEELIFKVNYLGDEMPTMAINFSRPGHPVIAQYYQFIRLGFDGYKKIQQTSRDVAMYLASELKSIGCFDIIHGGTDSPVVTWELNVAKTNGFWTLFDLSEELRKFGWQVPAYTMAPGVKDKLVMRAVIKQGMTHDLTDLLIGQIKDILHTHLNALTRNSPIKEKYEHYLLKKKTFSH